MKFSRLNGGAFELSKQVLTILSDHRQVSAMANEAGGLLLGRMIEGSRDVVVDELTVPDVNDRRGRFFFFRHQTSAQRKVTAAWNESGKTRNYLGEWHTHPEDIPSPSNQDLKDWFRIVQKSSYEQESLFFVIAGQIEIRVWEYFRNKQNPELLSIVDTDVPSVRSKR